MRKLLCILCLLCGLLYFNSAEAYYHRPYRYYSYTRHYRPRAMRRYHYRRPMRYSYRRYYRRYW